MCMWHLIVSACLDITSTLCKHVADTDLITLLFRQKTEQKRSFAASARLYMEQNKLKKCPPNPIWYLL